MRPATDFGSSVSSRAILNNGGPHRRTERTNIMSTAEAKKKRVTVPAFAVEIDHHRNADVIVQSIPGCRLRSAYSITKTAKDVKTGEQMIPRSQAMSQFPELPGMQLHINPAELKYRIIDPLHGNEKLCDKIASILKRQNQISNQTVVRGCETKEGTLDPHRMKTLCREVIELINLGDAKLANGIKPSPDDIDDLDGKYLLNPGSRVQNTQPIFEEDYEKWFSDLTKSGG